MAVLGAPRSVVRGRSGSVRGVGRVVEPYRREPELGRSLKGRRYRVRACSTLPYPKQIGRHASCQGEGQDARRVGAQRGE